jgi:hypothetical protein
VDKITTREQLYDTIVGSDDRGLDIYGSNLHGWLLDAALEGLRVAAGRAAWIEKRLAEEVKNNG